MGLRRRASVVRKPQTASWSHPTRWSHLQIDRADAETIARRPARLQPACSARRPARRCVVCTRVACHHPSWYVTRNARIDVGKVPGRFDPDRRTKSQLLLSLSYEG